MACSQCIMRLSVAVVYLSLFCKTGKIMSTPATHADDSETSQLTYDVGSLANVNLAK
jgi:hypothetical protein